jgi:hypothetical protein
MAPTLMTFLMAEANFKPTFSCINTSTILKPSYHSSYTPAYEDGTGSVPKRRHTKFRHRGITQKKKNIQHSQHGENLKSRKIKSTLCEDLVYFTFVSDINVHKGTFHIYFKLPLHHYFLQCC